MYSLYMQIIRIIKAQERAKIKTYSPHWSAQRIFKSSPQWKMLRILKHSPHWKILKFCKYSPQWKMLRFIKSEGFNPTHPPAGTGTR